MCHLPEYEIFPTPDSLIIYPGTKPGFMILKYFRPPYMNYREYYKNQTYDEIISAVKKQIADGEYRTFKPLPFEDFLRQSKIQTMLLDTDRENGKVLLQYCLSKYPVEFMTSKLPELDSLKSLFGQIQMQCMKGTMRKEIDDALNERSQLLDTKIKIYKDKSLPPHLYLGGLFAYLREITEYIRMYQKSPKGKLRMPRALENMSNEDIEGINKEPDTFTRLKMLSVFEGYTNPETIKKKITAETRPIKSPEKYQNKPDFASLILPFNRE